jgi:ATP-dependent Clp protease ATP-binding subunit ClpC
MFERFTDPARQVVVMAQEEARRLKHGHIGAEHLLLGVLRVEGEPQRVLRDQGVDADRMRDRILATVGEGEADETGQIPFTAEAKRPLELALREAMNLRVTFITPEHILLGLLRDPGGVAARALEDLGVDLDALAAAIPRTPDLSDAIPVTLGRQLLGDLGNPRTDARLLLAILERGGPAAQLLREHGLDEAAVRGLLGP